MVLICLNNKQRTEIGYDKINQENARHNAKEFIVYAYKHNYLADYILTLSCEYWYRTEDVVLHGCDLFEQ